MRLFVLLLPTIVAAVAWAVVCTTYDFPLTVSFFGGMAIGFFSMLLAIVWERSL